MHCLGIERGTRLSYCFKDKEKSYTSNYNKNEKEISAIQNTHLWYQSDNWTCINSHGQNL